MKKTQSSRPILVAVSTPSRSSRRLLRKAALRRVVGEPLKSGEIPSENIKVVQGDPAVQLPKLAKKLAAGVVVMGAVSRRGLPRDIGCSLLALKPNGFVSRVRAY